MLDVKIQSSAGIMMIGKLEGFGPAAHSKISANFTTVGDLLNASEADLTGVLKLNQRNYFLQYGEAALKIAYEDVQRDFALLGEMGASAISVYDDEYPDRLRSIPSPPSVIYAAGDLSLLDRSVSCVGTRQPTDFGEKVAARMTGMLAENKFSIVSGMAFGVDAISHRVALSAKVPTAAVLGCGLDAFNDGAYNLIKAIGESEGGIVISEQPLGKVADFGSLTRRNRIITGLSLATFVYQCEQDSGTMHSVKYAVLQGRPIFAPMIPENYRADPMNQAVMNMTSMSPIDFAHLCGWKSEYLDAAMNSDREFLAEGIRGVSDYPLLVEKLDKYQRGVREECRVENDIANTF
jgi:DNA processing protein